MTYEDMQKMSTENRLGENAVAGRLLGGERT